MREVDKSILNDILENHKDQVEYIAVTRTGNKEQVRILSDYLTFLEERLFGEWLPCAEELLEDSNEYKEAFDKLDDADKANVHSIVKYRGEVIVVCVDDPGQCYYCIWGDKVYSCGAWCSSTELGYHLNRAIDLKLIDAMGGFMSSKLRKRDRERKKAEKAEKDNV